MSFITRYWTLDVIIVLITIIISAYLYVTRKFKYWKKRGVMEVSPIPIVGSFSDCIRNKKSVGARLKEIYDQGNGEPYIGFFVFDKPFLLVRDEEIVKNVLIKDFNHFPDRYFTTNKTDRLAYANLFFIKNPIWKILRMKLTPFFTPGKLKKTTELIKECSDNMVNHIDSLNLENKENIMEVKDMSIKFTTDVISTVAFGLNSNSFTDPNAEFCKHTRQIFHPSRNFEMFLSTFAPSLCSLTGITCFGKHNDQFMRKIFWETIAQRQESGEKRNDLIDILIDLKKNHDGEEIEGFKFDGDDLLAQAAIFLVAAYETSAVTISFALYELALNPEIQNRLRKEITEGLVKSDGKLTYEMITSLPYLDMVICEVLRVYPPAEYLNRHTTKTYKVPNSNLVIEKNIPIFISVRGLHYDSKYYPDPDKFDPERFNEKNKHTRPAHVYLPFGEGPHICIGYRMGLLEIKLALVNILNSFEVTPCERTLIPMKLDKGIFTAPLNNVIYLNIKKLTPKN